MTQYIRHTLQVAALILVIAVPLSAQTAPPESDVMKVREAYTLQAENDACGNIVSGSNASSTDFHAQANFTVANFLKKLIDIGFDSGVVHKKSEYQGPSQADLRGMSDDQRKCRIYVFKEMTDAYIAADTAKATKEAKPATPVPGAPPPVDMRQDNRGSGGTNIQNVGPLNILVPKPPELILTAEQLKIASQLLQQSPSTIRLILPSPLPDMADGTTTPLGNQIHNLFLLSNWKTQDAYLGSGPIGPGITVVGPYDLDVVRSVRKAFDAAHIPYQVQTNGVLVGAGFMEGAPAAITISRSTNQ